MKITVKKIVLVLEITILVLITFIINVVFLQYKRETEELIQFGAETVSENFILQRALEYERLEKLKIEADLATEKARHKKTSDSYAEHRARAIKSSRVSSVRVSNKAMVSKQVTQTLKTPLVASKVGKQFLSKYFSGSQLEVAYKIMMCESGGRTHAKNGGHYGLFQISAKYHYKGRNPEDLYNPDLNARIAAKLASDGWSEWSCK